MAKRKKTIRTPKKKYSHPLLKYVRGDTAISLIIIVIIVGSILLAGGIFPKEPGSNGTGQGNQLGREYVIDQDSLNQAPDGQNNLQLDTIQFKACAETITLNLLLDRTGSMGSLTPSGATKISRLKEAVLALTNNLSDNSIIGIQSFASSLPGQHSITNDVPVDLYANNKGQIPGAVNSLNANGQTPTYEALNFSYSILQEATQRFPDRQFNFVLVSDGQPVPDEQDPRLYNPNPADQIKALGVNVYTLAIYDQSQAGNPALADLLRSVSSDPNNNYFQANSADDTTRLLTSITQKICDSQVTPTPVP